MTHVSSPRHNETMGDGDIFGEFRAEYRRLSVQLTRLTRPIWDELYQAGGLDLSLSDVAIAAGLVQRFQRDMQPPEVGALGKQSAPEYRRAGVRMQRTELLIDIDGSPDLVNYWPDQIESVSGLARDREPIQSGFDPRPPEWVMAEGQLVFRVEFRSDQPWESQDLKRLFDEEADRARRIVAAVSEQTHIFFRELEQQVVEAVAARRAEHEALASAFDGIDLPLAASKALSPDDSERSRATARKPANESSDTTVAVVFVHGLGSTSEATWAGSPSFPELVEDAAGATSYFYSYPTTKFRLRPFKKYPGIQDLAAGLRSFLELEVVEERILLVCHSMGGLIAKKMLMDAHRRNESPGVDQLLLYGTPNNGSALAAIGKLVGLPHRQMRQLEPSSDFIRDLEAEWKQVSPGPAVPTHYVIAGNDQAVDPASARGTWDSSETTMVIEASHSGVVAPASPGHLGAIRLRRKLDELLSESS